MRPIEAALETLGDLAANAGKVPASWIEIVKDHSLNEGMSLVRSDFAVIVNVLQKIAPCKFLEIGAGSSTAPLFGYNPNGLNISLEDSSEWVEKVRLSLPGGIGTILHYENAPIENPNMRRTDWKAQLRRIQGYDEEKLRVQYHLLQKRAIIPDWLWSIQFDLILVDGPLGSGAGRSGTTLLASKLAGPTSVVFVDDALNRPHEMEKVERFLPDRFTYAIPGGKLMVLI